LLARLSLGLPFVLIVPDGITFALQSYEDTGYVVYTEASSQKRCSDQSRCTR
jgi:hypothetical protein